MNLNYRFEISTVDIQNGHDHSFQTFVLSTNRSILDRQGFRIDMDKCMLSFSHFSCVFFNTKYIPS